MTDIVARLRDPATPIVMRPKPDPLRLEAAAEIERLRTRLAIQFGMHPGGDLAKATDAEIERLRALSQNNAHSWDEIVHERNALRALIRAIEAQSIASTEPDYVAVPARLITEAARALEPKS